MANPPTPLPKIKKRPVPFSLAHPDSITDAKAGGTPEFTQQMITEETERLDKARKQVIAEQDRWRAILIEKENLLNSLKKQLET
jgi:YEATS domain-containing protein 4